MSSLARPPLQPCAPPTAAAPEKYAEAEQELESAGGCSQVHAAVPQAGPAEPKTAKEAQRRVIRVLLAIAGIFETGLE